MTFDKLPKPTDPWLFELWRKYQDLAFIQSLSESDSHPMIHYSTVLIENCVSGILDYCKPKQKRESPGGDNAPTNKPPYYTVACSSIPPIQDERVQELLDLREQEEERVREKFNQKEVQKLEFEQVMIYPVGTCGDTEDMKPRFNNHD